MKRKHLLFVLALFAGTCMYAADDNWLDVNFTRDSNMWLDALPELSENGINLQVSLNGEYLGFGMNGAFGRFAVSNYDYTPLDVEDMSKQLIYALRLHNNEQSYWSFPGTADVGSIKLNLLCGNANNTAVIKVQKFVSLEDDGEGNMVELWEDFSPAVVLEVPPHEFSATSFVVEKELNITEPTRLRLKGPTERNVHIFAAVITKNNNTSVNSTKADLVNLSIVNRTLRVTSKLDVNNIEIFTMTGTTVAKINGDEGYKFDRSGAYLIRTNTAQGAIVNKIIIM